MQDNARRQSVKQSPLHQNLTPTPLARNVQSRTPHTQFAKLHLPHTHKWATVSAIDQTSSPISRRPKAHFDSRCVPQCFDPRTTQGKKFSLVNYGDLFETNPWAKHIPDTLARRRYDSQMNIARVTMVDRKCYCERVVRSVGYSMCR